jgi:hypothetical protein
LPRNFAAALSAADGRSLADDQEKGLFSAHVRHL